MFFGSGVWGIGMGKWVWFEGKRGVKFLIIVFRIDWD